MFYSFVQKICAAFFAKFGIHMAVFSGGIVGRCFPLCTLTILYQQRGSHRRLGKAHGAREDPEAASFRRARKTRRGQPWQATSCRPICLGTQCPAIVGVPTKQLTSWGKEKQTERLSFRACAEAKDTQFVLTQDRLPWLGLQAVKTPSTSCESCQALSALFPIAGARAANTAETISKEWRVYVRKQKILLHEAQGKFLHQ